MLSVNVDDMLTELAQQVRGHRAIVDECSRTSPVADDAPHDALVRPVVELPIGEPCPDRCVRPRVEHAADFCPLGAGTDHVSVGARAEEERQGIDDDGLPRTGLAGERGHSRCAFELQAVDDRERPNRQVREHAVSIRGAAPLVPWSASDIHN